MKKGDTLSLSKGWMYILKCADGSYYTGSTNNLELRIAQHQAGEGAKHTKKRLPVKLVYYEEYQNVADAFKREKQVQGWSRKKKEALINGTPELLPELAVAYRDKDGGFENLSHRNENLSHRKKSKVLPEALEGNIKGWEYGVLEDAVKKGSTNISLNKVKDDDGEYPLFSAKGFNKNISFFHQEKEYLAIIKDGAGIGRVSKHPAKSSVVATMQYLIPKDNFNISFIEYFLKGIDFEKHRNGSTIPHIYFKDYKSERFPILPLPEQKRIVAILDRAFEAIDQAKANAEQNLKNAKELFESYLQGVFENKGDDWEEKTLEQISETFGRGKSKHRPRNDKKLYGGDYPFIQTGDIRNCEHYITDYSQTYNEIGLAQT